MGARGAEFLLERASVQFGKLRALDAADLHVEPGEAIALVGPSGAGKTTLLHVLNGTQRPFKGWVKVDKQPLGELSRRELRRVRSAIGFVHQDLHLVPNIRVAQNVLAGRLGRLSFAESVRLMVFPPQSALEEVFRLLDRVGVGEKLFERTDRLSGGQRQRVAIARALYQDPSALLADEPVSSVDPARARATVDLLTRISREEQITLCVSLHSLDLARHFFPRLVGLRAGKIVFDRRSEELSEAEFEALYDLRPEELTAGGS